MRNLDPKRVFVLCMFGAALVMSLPGSAVAGLAPVAVWHMEGLGADGHTMRDSSSSRPANEGATTDIKVVNGWVRNGYKFNGSTSRVAVPDHGSLDPGGQPIRIVTYAKFRFRPDSGVYVLLTKGVVAKPNYKVLIDSQGEAVCSFRGRMSSAKVTSARLATRKRHQIICGKVDRRIWIRVDGTKTVRKVRIGRISNVRRLLLGTGYRGGSHFRGGLDETTIQIGIAVAQTPVP